MGGPVGRAKRARSGDVQGGEHQGPERPGVGVRGTVSCSEARWRLLAGPVLDLGLAEDKVEEQARQANSCREQEGVPPAKLRILLAGNHRLVSVPVLVSPGSERLWGHVPLRPARSAPDCPGLLVVSGTRRAVSCTCCSLCGDFPPPGSHRCPPHPSLLKR